jgi:hypothetical protein
MRLVAVAAILMLYAGVFYRASLAVEKEALRPKSFNEKPQKEVDWLWGEEEK